MIINIPDNGAFNYYHFIFYCLGNVAAIPDCEKVKKIYVPFHTNNTFILPMLMILFPEAEIIDTKHNKITDKIDFTPDGKDSEKKENLLFLRNKFLPYVGIKKPEYNRVYISRRRNTESPGHPNISARHIYNEKEMMDKLKQLGFVEVLLEDLHFFDHINIFYHAEIVLAAHGAALTNAIFAGENTNIVEIMNINRTYFHSICNELNIPYHHVNFLYNTDKEDNGFINIEELSNFITKKFGN